MQASSMTSRLTTDKKPLSNSEVNQLIKSHFAKRDNDQFVTSISNESGYELMKETREYLQQFN